MVFDERWNVTTRRSRRDMEMLRKIDYEEGARLRDFLLSEGYTEQNLRARGVTELPSAKLRNLPRLLHVTHEPCGLNTLLRWFWLGERQDRAGAERTVPSSFISLAVDWGLLRLKSAFLVPQAMLVHVEGLFIVSDHPRKIDDG